MTITVTTIDGMYHIFRNAEGVTSEGFPAEHFFNCTCDQGHTIMHFPLRNVLWIKREADAPLS